MGLQTSGEFCPFQSGSLLKITCNARLLQDTPLYSEREILLICCLNRNHKHISGVAALRELPAGNSREEIPLMRAESQHSFPDV